MMYTSEDILQQLDACAADHSFPMLDNGYIYPAGTRLTAYRDDERWAIVIELIGFSYRGGGHGGINNHLHLFGNCLNQPPGLGNESILCPSSDHSYPTFDREEEFYLQPGCATFLLRNEVFPVEHDRTAYVKAGINPEHSTKISAQEFLRLLDYRYHDRLIATEKEIRQHIPDDIPGILEWRDWHHPNLAGEELPGANASFIWLAKVLETGDIQLPKPEHPHNTHWSNWPFGGSL